MITQKAPTNVMQQQSAGHMRLYQDQTIAIDEHATKKLMFASDTDVSHPITHTIICQPYSSVEYTLFIAHSLQITLNITLADHASIKVRGAYLLSGTQTVSITTLQHHTGPRTTSDLSIKGLLAGSAQANYSGTIVIDHDARFSNASQQNINLMLSPSAKAVSKPTLEVHNNDVHCAHGSAIGQLDEQQLLYLQSRGLDRKSAKKIIIQGFFVDLLAAMPEQARVVEQLYTKAE